jgi:TolB-like protein
VTDPSHAVFLSYASQDAGAARKICEALRAAGIEVWFDQSELRGGDAWDRQIRERIQNCRLFIALISTHTEARDEGYFRREWKLAVDRTHDMSEKKAFLLPVAIDATPERGAAVPDKFHEMQWTRLPAGETPAVFVERVRRLLSPESPTSNRTPTSTAPAGAPAITEPVRAPRRTRPLLIAVAAVVVVALAYFVADRLWLSRRSAIVTVSAQSPLPTASEKSIAVLPFVDMSEKHDQEYFADGLAEEVRDLLAQVPELKVPARTSSFYFRGRQTTTAEIARVLGVAHVLEGSVRRAGDRIRVTVDLVRADSGYHVWSQTFDRDVKDVFAVQDEIAAAAVAALKLRLSPASAPVSARQTSSPEAYEAFLRGREKFYVGTAETHAEAIALFRRAIELDSKYAAAYAWLAQTLGSQLAFLGRIATTDEWAERQHLIQRAIELAPSFADPYAVRAVNEMAAANWSGAKADLERALALDPQDTRALRYYARYLASQGDLTRALEIINRAIALDPLDVFSLGFRAEFEQSTGARAAARRDLEHLLEIVPGQSYASFNLAWLDLRDGKPDAALTRVTGLTQRWWVVSVEAGAKCVRGDRAAGIALIDAWVKELAADAPLRDAIRTYAICGATASAVALIEHEVDQGNERYADFLVEAMLYSPDFAPLKGDPRFEAIVRRLHPHA